VEIGHKMQKIIEKYSEYYLKTNKCIFSHPSGNRRFKTLCVAPSPPPSVSDFDIHYPSSKRSVFSKYRQNTGYRKFEILT